MGCAGALVLLLMAANPEVESAEQKAREALAAGKVSEALEAFEEAIRAADETPVKARLRDAYRKAGWADPPALSPVEEAVAAAHVKNEKVRVFEAAAGRLEKDQPHAAVVLRRAVIELLGGPDEDEAKRHVARIHDIVRRLTERPSDEQKEAVRKLIAAGKSGDALLEAGRKLLAQRDYRTVVRLCQEILFGEYDQGVQNAAQALREDAETAAENDVPAADKQAALEVLTDERFERIANAVSRHFIFIGPEPFVSSLTKDDRTMLDLAYIFQSDLAQRHLTADGVRICVYYQETFDFGGGLAIAGGKYIRIGNRAIRAPIAGMLHYHELGHCIFGRGWLHDGFTEGLADFAAGLTLDLLGQTDAARNFIVEARDQFVRFYLGRDVRYFDIQSYRPSAGFLFSFLPPGDAPYDWAPYRRVFHRMREAQFAAWPAREHQLMRYFGYLMAAEYGPSALERLREWGWPVDRADWTRVPAEAAGPFTDVKRGNFLVSQGGIAEGQWLLQQVLDADPTGPLAARAHYGLMRAALALGDAKAADVHRRAMGLVDRFLVLGPFHARSQTPYVVFPPESRIDLAKREVRFGIESANWKEGKVREDGYVDLRRDQGFGYPENACAFALVYAFVEAATPARFWLGSDDGHTLYLNNEMLEKRDTRRGFRVDDDFADGMLEPGWNRVLLKVHNTSGEWGFLLRLTRPDGAPIAGLRLATDDLEAKVARYEPPKSKSVTLVHETFKGALRGSRWDVPIGKFDTQNGQLHPLGTQKMGLWYRFKVDPDKPKDGPANIMWLKSDELARADDLELELVVAAGGKKKDRFPGKFGFTIDGEGENDGQSGHTFVLEHADEGVRCHWYRYDQLLFLQPGVELAEAETFTVRLRRQGRKWWLSVNDVPLFADVDTPRLPHLGFGLLTWGRGPAFESIKLVRLEAVR